MDDVLNDLARNSDRCAQASRFMVSAPLGPMWEMLLDAASNIGQAWSGLWTSEHANLYTGNLQKPPPGQQFSSPWGSTIKWYEYDYETIVKVILERVQLADIAPLQAASQAAQEAFEAAQQELLPLLDATLSIEADSALLKLRRKIEQQPSHTSFGALINAKCPKSIVMNLSEYNQGMKIPHHIYFAAKITEMQSYGMMAKEMANTTRQAERYIRYKGNMKIQNTAKPDGKIFIGHGRSRVWKDLKDFLKENLGLDYEEYNREPTAGMSTKERLETMLDRANFGFLVMTAEDEHADSTLHARENVIHEIGLFQGRLGFLRAIILLEEGCKEFSNITGLGEIRFPNGNIMAVSEEIRLVLKREGILK